MQKDTNQPPPASRAPLKPLVLDFENRAAEMSEDRKFVTALARGLDILRAFQSRIGPMSNKQLAEVTGIPKPTISRLTFTLKALGYLKQSNRNGKYELGPGVLSLGYPLLSNLRIRHAAHDHMAELARVSSCTVALATCDHLNMVFVDECCGNASTTLRIDVGARIEMASSAIGRAYLAGLPGEDREAHFAELAVVHGERWPELQQRIHAAIRQVDERGFCIVDGEWRRNTRTVAAPLISRDGRTVMAMSCGGPAYSLPMERLEQELGPRLVHICTADAFFLGG